MSPSGTRWTLVTLGLTILPHLTKMPLWLALGLLCIVAWRWYESRHTYQPPAMLIRVIATVLGVASVVAAHGMLLGRRAATTLLTVMLVLKLLELARLRDARLVVTTSFFLTATHFLFNQDLLYLPWLLAIAVIGLAALRQLQADSLLEISQQREKLTATPPRQRLAMAGRILFLAIPVSLALFVLFPRLSTPLWGIPEYALDGKTGLSDDMSPGRIQQMFLDDSPAFRVTFDYNRPFQHELYWRGPVLWHFDGTTWNRGNLQRADRSQLPAINDAELWYEVQLEPHERHWLFALDHPAQWPDDAFLTHDFQLLSREPITSLTRYQAASVRQFRDSPNQLSTYNRARSLQLPPDRNPRARELANEWRQSFSDDAQLLQHALNWFREEPFYYSLEAPPLGRDGVDEFLFDLRLGYCEYYASAFTVLMRAAGIPARVVTGYQGGTFNQVGDYLLIRHSDAHAWTEVWLPGQGWTRVDPTGTVSPDRVQYGASAALSYSRGWHDWSWIQHFQTSLDATRNMWNQWVLSFDSRRQERLLKPFGIGQLRHQHLVLLLVVIMAAAGMIIHLLIRHRRRENMDDALRIYRRGLRRLRRLKLPKAANEGPQEYAQRVFPMLNADSRETWLRITTNYCRLRYAGEITDVDNFSRLVKRFRPRLNPQSSTD